jgi:hypothetical protein
MGVGTTNFEHEKLCIMLEGPQLLVQILCFVEWNPTRQSMHECGIHFAHS